MPNQHTNGPGPIAIQYRDQIIQQLEDGRYVDDIAEDLAVNPSSISRLLTADPEYQSARELGTERRLRAKQRRLALISDIGFVDGKPVGLSKEQSNLARVCVQELDAEQWFAEREHSERWGAKSEMRMTGGVKVDHTIKMDAQSLLDLIKTVAQTPNAQSVPAIIDNATGEVSSDDA